MFFEALDARLPQTACVSDKGPYIKDVRTRRGEGGSPKADIVREVAGIYYCRSSPNADNGGGFQNPKNFADVLRK